MTADEKTVSDDVTELDIESDAVEISEPAEEPSEESADENSEETALQSAPQDASPQRHVGTWITAAVLAVLLIASAGVTAWLYFGQYRADQAVDSDAQQAVLKAAHDGTIALLSYSPETLDADFSSAKSHLTGDFLSYYTNFTEQIVTPAAKQRAVKTSAAVIRKGIAEIHPDRAVVLVFLNQVTTSKENPDGSYTTSAVKVSLERHDGAWLISSFDPV